MPYVPLKNISGKQVGDLVVSALGPDTDRNARGGTNDLEIYVVGSGEIQIEEHTAPISAPLHATDPNGFGHDLVPDPNVAWTPVGGPVDSSAGVVVRALAAGAGRRFWRALVSTTGEGNATIRARWTK